MGLMAHGGFAITSTGGTFNHHQGINDDTLNEIIRLLKLEVRKPDSDILKVGNNTIRSISIFTDPDGPKQK